MKVYWKRMRDRGVVHLPKHAHKDDAGLDLETTDSVVLLPGQDAWLGTGLAWSPAPSFLTRLFWKPALLIRPRSSMAREGLDITEGTVDAGYRGEIKIHVRNVSSTHRVIRPGERVAQAVIILLPILKILECDELDETSRGRDGFGSTGK